MIHLLDSLFNADCEWNSSDLKPEKLYFFVKDSLTCMAYGYPLQVSGHSYFFHLNILNIEWVTTICFDCYRRLLNSVWSEKSRFSESYSLYYLNVKHNLPECVHSHWQAIDVEVRKKKWTLIIWQISDGKYIYSDQICYLALNAWLHMKIVLHLGLSIRICGC